MKKDIYLKQTGSKTLNRLSIALFGILMSVFTLPASAQTVLISPTGDGGFETGTTFATNGWTVVNASNGNSWCVGTAAFSAGARGAYISTSSAGSNNNYNNYGGFLQPSAARTVHFYKNVTFPAGQTQIKLSFKWRCNAGAFGLAADNDDIRVFLAPTSVTPVSGTVVNATYLIGGPYILQGSTYQNVLMTLPASLAGTTQRLIFSWRNDNNLLGDNPAGAFDEISLTSCAPPVVNASNTGPQCSGTTLGLSATGGSSYSWSGPDGFTSTSSNPTISNVAPEAAGIYTVVVTSNGCSSTTTTTASINSAPTGVAPTSSLAAACVNTPYTLTANVGTPISTTNSTNVAIPDATIGGSITTISSSIVVANSFTANQVVSVMININHPNTEDLDILLRAPNGSQIGLSTDNGGSGDNYTNTVFKTGFPSITSGSAPFTGKYSPEQPFSSLTGNANGTWQLIISDDAWLDAGNLINWTLTTVSTAGVTYTWSSTPSGFSGSGATVSTSAATSTTYQVSTSNGTCSSSPFGSVAVNILAPPTVTASSNAPVCENSDLSLNASGGVSYAWSGPAFSSSQQNPTINAVGQANAGNYTVIVTDAFGCTNSSSFTVGINENPTVSVTSQTDVTCNAGSDGGFVVAGSGGDGFYLYSNGFDSNFDGIFSNLTAGTYVIEIIDGNSCMSTSAATVIEPDPTTIAMAGSDQSVCFEASAILEANTAIVGTGSWSVVSGSAIFTDPLDPTASVSGLTLGDNIIRWTIDNGVCGSNYSDLTLNMKEVPVATISGTQEICNGSSANISLAFSGSGPWTYSLNGGAPVTTSNNPEVVSVIPSSSTAYTVSSMSDATCPGSSTGTADITVTTAPPANSVFLTPTTSACVGSTYVASTNVVIGATKYTWSVPAGTLINGQTGPVTTASNTVTLTLGPLAPNSSGWEICAFALNACGQTNTNCKYIRGALSMSSPIAGTPVACPSTTANYSINSIAGASAYEWSGTNGITFTGSGTSVTAEFPTGFTTGSICVSGKLPCGYTGPSRCMTVTNGTPLLGNMAGSFTVCPGANGVTFNVPPSPGANNYNWTLPIGASFVSGTGTNSISVDFGPAYNGGDICVTATSICGLNSLPRCRTISSNRPGTPGNISGGVVTGVCGQTISYAIGGVSGATSYTWSSPSGSSIASANGSNSIDVAYSNNFTTGNLCVTANNGCGSSTPRCSLIKGVPANPGTISGPSGVCANESGLSYSIAPVSGSNGYLWTVPAGVTIISGQNTSSILVDWGNSSGVITVKALNDCGPSGTRTMTVTIACRMSSSVSPDFSIFPNPATESATVSFESVRDGQVNIQLLDLSGRLVFEKNVTARNGNNQLILDLKQLLRGTYLVKVNGIDNQSIGRLVIQ